MKSKPALFSCQGFTSPPKFIKMLTFVYNYANKNNNHYNTVICIVQLSFQVC